MRGIRAGVLAVIAVVVLISVAAQSAFAVGETDWLGRVSEIRAGSGLPLVTENPTWTAGILAHLTYLAETPAAYRTGIYESDHTENPASPFYSAEGAVEAEHSDLFPAGGTQSPVGAINGWLTAPFHAIGMLRPNLQQIAFGRDPATGAAGLDVISGLASGTAQEVLFPGNGSTIDLNRFGGERPTPIQTCEAEHPGADYSTPGLPLIAMLTTTPEAGVAASLRRPNGVIVTTATPELCIVTAENFVSSDTIYGPTGRSILESDDAILVISRTPLVAGTYAVSISEPSQAPLAWSFTENPPAEPAPPVVEQQTTTGGGVTRERSRPGVHFGAAHFRQGYVPIRLEAARGALPTHFKVRSISRNAASVEVAAGRLRTVRARIRRYGMTSVSVSADGKLLARRQFFGHRPRGTRG